MAEKAARVKPAHRFSLTPASRRSLVGVRSGIGLEGEVAGFVAQGHMGHPWERVAQGLIDAVFDFEDLAGGELVGDLNMEINVDIVLHSVRADGVGTANALNLLGDRSDESGVEASGIGNDFDPFDGDFINGAGEKEDNSDREKRVEPRKSKGATGQGGDGEKGGVDIGSGVSGIGKKEGAGDLEPSPLFPIGEESIDDDADTEEGDAPRAVVRRGGVMNQSRKSGA